MLHRGPRALAVHQREQRVVFVAGGNGNVLAEPERVVLVDPSVIGCLGAAWIGHARELRSRQRIERPAFGTMLAGRGRAVQDLALRAVEAGKMTARQRRPDDAWLSISMPRGE